MKNNENKLDNNNFALGELPNESKTKLGEKKNTISLSYYIKSKLGPGRKWKPRIFNNYLNVILIFVAAQRNRVDVFTN